jgi:tuftelin-interacting protein 11
MDRASRLHFDPSRLSKKSAAQGYSSSEGEEDEDDYAAPGAGDDYGDFNPRKRRRIGGNTKERAALGIFGSDSDDDGPGRRWKAKTTLEEEQEKSAKAVDAEYSNDSDDNDAEDDDEGATGAGLGFGAASRGLGFVSGGKDEDSDAEMEESKPTMSFTKSSFDGSNPLGRGFVPSSANVPVLKTSSLDDTRAAPTVPKPSAFGGAGKGKPNPKSFGARMMAKMGYVGGQGLGKEGQGRNTIIEVNLRPQGVGLGAVREKTDQERQEEKRQAKLRGEALEEDSEEEAKRRKKERKKKLAAGGGAGSTSGASTPRRHKTIYMTAEEAKRASGPQTPTSYSILDLTGPGTRLITTAAGILTPGGREPWQSPSSFLHTPIDAAEADRRSARARRTWVDKELKRQETEETDIQRALESLQLLSSAAEELILATEWEAVVSRLQKMAELNTTFVGISDIAVAAVDPFLRDPSWDPLDDPTRYATDLRALKTLLWRPREKDDVATAYESMIYSRWFRKVNNSIRDWNVHDPNPLLNVVDAWKELLPQFVLDELTENITRRLEAAVEEWNPKKKRQSSSNLPHLWVFPWLPYLSDYHLDPRGHGLVAHVRRKFRQLVGAWPFERGVIPGIAQWRDLLGRKEWRGLAMSHIVPSMGRYLRENFRVEPSDQEPLLPILTGSLRWAEDGVLAREVVAQVVIADVFPFWHEKLQEWLGLEEEANMEEVVAWFEWWQELLREIDGPQIQAEFTKGMRTIEAALG